MKIKTITCHDVYNSGASLQAYALMKYLQNNGHEVEIIDYKPDYLSNHYKFSAVSNPRYEKNLILKIIYLILKFPERLFSLKNKKKYDEFRDKHLKITNKRYGSNEELKSNPPEADVYLCGSDQIWNSKLKNGKDPAFYLDFAPSGKVRAAYAASFATESIEYKIKDVIRERVSKLDYIGVREISALDILKDLSIKKGVQVLDPVFLLDKNQWKELTYDVNNNEKYILVYDFDGNELIREVATKIAKEKNLSIYTVFKSDYSDKVIKQVGPIDFISYIKGSEFVISNSFHGTAFSIIFKKQFVVVNRKEAINTRMRDLLNILNIKDRLVSENYDFNSIIKKIDYKNVDKYLREKIKFSKEYLGEVTTIKEQLEELNEKESIVCN